MEFDAIIQRIREEGSARTARCWLDQIEEEYGAVPLIFQRMSEKPEVLISHLLYKGSVTQLSTLEPKVVELISLAVGAALKCSHCVEYHMKAAQAKGATREEILEAVLIAGLLANAAVLADAYRVVNGAECDASCDLSGVPKQNDE
ncbi:MAG: carboxymuconolactone decarboxylase family protein [Methanocalculus sp. MSAO_Arc1]|uniref:carboxymuconolactone decarboxylase family protein n=1 Tax=Methanocalculus TaxID=71151 RepID=UPI000FEFBAF2|nr:MULTISPECIES: carboxymuconolactone decarboxylase family protein [unclassified Methanocalculus]MCP1662728.1 AhpD family alkylhydroperoxidase [Methanocalculus sp. AMF5]RQD79960.1 MAG: carboxymuconolactone decarboxylase family protein [Methanocalculus sp. MSAO_Arc1]